MEFIVKFNTDTSNDLTLMTANFGFDLNREDAIFGFADASLRLYKLLHAVGNYIKRTANNFIAVLAMLLAIILVLVAIPMLAILFFFLSIGLIISILVFKQQIRNNYQSLRNYDRKELIELHVRLRHAVKRIEAVKSSDLLFSTPGVGQLMRAYFQHLSVAEKTVKIRAYPVRNVQLQKSRIHAYDPSDPWQQDLSDLRRFNDQPTS